MNTTTYENDGNLAIAEAYYNHMLKKNFDAMEQCLHPDVHFISPLAEMSGRGDVAKSARNLSNILASIEIRAKFSSGNQIMFAYDFMFPQPIGKLRSAVLMEFKDNLISKIELFFDGSLFE